MLSIVSLAVLVEAREQSAGSDDKEVRNADSAQSVLKLLVLMQLQVMVITAIMVITHQHKMQMIHSF